jgi:high-affinity Fe2+/Pb2+ permease
MNRFRKQNQIHMLIMYLISALLFMASVDLHIHAGDESVLVEQSSSAVHIGTIADKFAVDQNSDEVNINPSGVLKSGHSSFVVLAIFLLTTLIVACCRFDCTARILEIPPRLTRLAFHGTPPLRAPPVFNS